MSKNSTSPFDTSGPSSFSADSRFTSHKGKSASQVASAVVDAARKRDGKYPGTIYGLNNTKPVVNRWAKK